MEENPVIMKRFIVFIFPALLCLPCLSGRTFSSPGGDSISRTVLFPENPDDTSVRTACYRIPSMAVAEDGTVVVAVDQRVPSCSDLRWNRDINIVVRRSTDGGRTWTAAERIVDFPEGISASDPSMISDAANGTLHLFYNYMDLDRAPGVYRFHRIESRDCGNTWSAPQDITDMVVPEEWEGDFMFITSGQGAVSPDGTLLHTLVNIDEGMHVVRSCDSGRTWELLPVPVRPADESKIIALSDSLWMLNCRVNGAGCRYVYYSTDRGASWTGGPDSSLSDPGCNAAVAEYALPSGPTLLLFVNATDSTERTALGLRRSLDGGKEWSRPFIINAGSSGYSDIAVLPSGDAVIVYERDGYSRMDATVIPCRMILGEYFLD